MNVTCMIDNVAHYLVNNSAFINFCGADSTSISEHIFKWFAYGDDVYPVAVLANGPQDINFEGDLISSWTVPIMMKIYDVKQRYLNDDGTQIEDNGIILYEFMQNIDAILKEICGFNGVPIKNIHLAEGPLFDEPEVKDQGEGEIICITYVFNFEPGGN
jgi:hypothetical protein